MPPCFETAVLSSSIAYPNAVVWSEENLVAVACGNIIIILSPANPGVRGVITVPSCKPFPLGVIDDGGPDSLNGCLLQYHISRDYRPCVRSISWSPTGLANNAGCLLAVCTSEGHVKLYRFPYCEFSVEWIEVLDISEMLYKHFKNTNFGEFQIVPAGYYDVISRQDDTDHGFASDRPASGLRKNPKRRRQDAANAAVTDPEDLSSESLWQIVPYSVDKLIPQEKKSGHINLPLITAEQYASRNEMLMSLTVSWSPLLETSGNGVAIPSNSSKCCSILAVGGKCGRISFWRIHGPKCYSIYNSKFSNEVSLVSILKAHDTWITAICWAFNGSKSNVSNAQLILATASSDGGVKIWRVNGEELLKSSEVIYNSCSLLKEVMTVDSATVSVLALTLPSQSPSKLLLAVGKGSGSFELWTLDMTTNEFEKVGCYDAHDRIVTGLAWAFDGRCLYSCSQDNSLKCWIFVGDSLCEVSLPLTSPGLKSSPDVPCAFNSCFGLAISPGNLAIAVARGFDTYLLNPMYQGRSHRAAVEFLWIGGQQLDLSSASCTEINNFNFLGFPEKELIWWEMNILWSLSQYENPSRLLNIWDVVAAFLAFKHSSPEYIEHILLKWLASSLSSQSGISSTLLFEALEFLPKLSSRQLYLINIITRRVMLKEDNVGDKQHKLEKLNDSKEQWMELLLRSEKEILERLVSFSFSATLNLLSDSSIDFSQDDCWSPEGLPQMEQWVSQSGKNVKAHSKFLAEEIGNVDKRRLQKIFGYVVDEQCNFCSSVVPFESTEYAICSGVNLENGVNQTHKLERCAVTMQILPTKPSWYCMCCQRRTGKLAPSILFSMLKYPSDFKSFLVSSACKGASTPYCPYCGLLLQRLQPEYSLSPSPV